jgi:hypothetical protein
LPVPAGDRGRYAAACLTAFASFAIFGLFTSLVPGMLIGLLDQCSLAVAGLVSFSVLGLGLAAQFLDTRSSVPIFAAGLTLLLTAAAWPLFRPAPASAL